MAVNPKLKDCLEKIKNDWINYGTIQYEDKDWVINQLEKAWSDNEIGQEKLIKANEKLNIAQEALERVKNHDGHRHSVDTDYIAEVALIKIKDLK